MSINPSSWLRPPAPTSPARPSPVPARLREWILAGDAAAVRYSARPGAVLGWLLAANVVLATVGVAAGSLAGDPALYFRELMPGTWLSAGHILAAAVTARAIHRRDPRGRRWYESFWGLSAVLLAGLAVVELTQPTVFLSKWLQNDAGLRAPSAIVDLDGMMMAFVLGAVAVILAARALEVLRHPRALGLFAAAAALGAVSQFIDATSRVSTWEFVVEDGVKALAGPFLVAGYLVVLRSVARRQSTD